MGHISIKSCSFILMFLSGFTSLSVLLLFCYWSPSLSLCMVFDTISSNIDDVLSINPSTNGFVFGDFNVLYKDCVTCSGGTDWPGELCYNFVYLKRWLTVELGSQAVICIVLLSWISFFLLMLVFVLQWLFLQWEILIMLSQFSLTFHQIYKGMPCFIA